MIKLPLPLSPMGRGRGEGESSQMSKLFLRFYSYQPQHMTSFGNSTYRRS